MTELESLCEEYLTKTGSTLWGRAWFVHETKSRKRAAKWLAQQLRGVMEVRRQHGD